MLDFPQLACSSVGSISQIVHNVSDDHDRLDNTKREGANSQPCLLIGYNIQPTFRHCFYCFSILGARDVHRRCKISFPELPSTCLAYRLQDP